MRDRRFVASHRGGPLDRASHALLARWAADCAGRVLPLFAKARGDVRPARALEVARAWANGQVVTGVAMKASVAAHAAARETPVKAAVAAARAAGHAVATAHAADHCMGALLYALKALEAAGTASGAELEAQLAKLPAHLLDQVAAGVDARLRNSGSRLARGKDEFAGGHAPPFDVPRKTRAIRKEGEVSGCIEWNVHRDLLAIRHAPGNARPAAGEDLQGAHAVTARAIGEAHFGDNCPFTH